MPLPRRLATVLLLTVLAVTLKPAQAPVAAPLELTARPIELAPDNPDLSRVGALSWRGGLALEGDTPAFGGFSDLVVSADGRRITMVGDKGNWARASLSYDAAGRLSGAGDGWLDSYRGPDGRAALSTAYQDAESLTERDGALLVGFEQRHRIWAYPDGLEAAANPFPAPDGLREAGFNAGAEALQQLADGRLLLIAEDRPDGAEAYRAWLYDAGAWSELAVARTPGYRPTGVTQLPDGDLLLLTRRFTLLGGFQSRLSRIPLAQVEAGATLEGREIAHFRRPYVTENFEGVAARRAAGGETHVYLLSDDNFLALQRTLLVMFALEEE